MASETFQIYRQKKGQLIMYYADDLGTTISYFHQAYHNYLYNMTITVQNIL